MGGEVQYISPRRHDRVTSSTCNCPVCRRKRKLLRPEERREMIEERRLRRIEKRYPLRDVPLFCRVFPEGLVGSCGFRYNGFCEVFEDGCIRWNELGDKMDYSVGKKSPFKASGGE